MKINLIKLTCISLLISSCTGPVNEQSEANSLKLPGGITVKSVPLKEFVFDSKDPHIPLIPDIESIATYCLQDVENGSFVTPTGWQISELEKYLSTSDVNKLINEGELYIGPREKNNIKLGFIETSLLGDSQDEDRYGACHPSQFKDDAGAPGGITIKAVALKEFAYDKRNPEDENVPMTQTYCLQDVESGEYLQPTGFRDIHMKSVLIMDEVNQLIAGKEVYITKPEIELLKGQYMTTSDWETIYGPDHEGVCHPNQIKK